MDYSLNFVLFYLLLQAILISCSYFYYNFYIKNVYLKHGKLTVFAGFSQLAVFTIHAFLLYLPYYLYTDWPALERGIITLIVGTAVILLGFTIMVVGMVTLGPFMRMMGVNSSELTIRGIYKYTRNPQILGYGLLLLGFGVLWPSWYIFAGFVSYGFIAHRMILTEELHLENLFADKFVSYCNRTPRYFRYPPNGS